eukprot:8057818-Pyramimonas_sp.AAC.1
MIVHLKSANVDNPSNPETWTTHPIQNQKPTMLKPTCKHNGGKDTGATRELAPGWEGLVSHRSAMFLAQGRPIQQIS